MYKRQANRYRLLSSGELRKLEQRLATKLGIMQRDAIILVFFPEAVSYTHLARGLVDECFPRLAKQLPVVRIQTLPGHAGN